MQHFGRKLHLISRTESKNQSIKDLIQAGLRGDRNAQKAIYDSLASKMMSVCLRYMGDREAALDILQEGFVTLFKRLDTYSGEGSFEGWARKIFVNTALMSLRKNDALKGSSDIDEIWNISSREESAVDKIAYNELMALVTSLPPGFRTVFNLYVVEGMSHKEIAESLGISEVTSRSQLQRARVLLQKKIGNR